jgi:protoheme ferro-lyase
MKKISWALIFIFPLLLGFSIVQFLVSSPGAMFWYLALSLACLLGILFLLIRGFEKRVLPLILVVILFMTSYLGTTYTFLNQEILHPLPELTRSVSDPGDGHTAVIYFTHGEHQDYSPNAWIETMRQLDKDAVPFIPKPFRPFFFNGFRGEYIEAGSSKHNLIHADMIDSLSALMHEEDDPGLEFYLSFLATDPRPDAMVIQALNEGASKIVLMPVFLTISSHTAEGIELVESVDLPSFDVPLCIADPMWQSLELMHMFLSKVDSDPGNTSKDTAGIMLIGHGQPAEWDLTYPTQTEQENIFREEVKELFIQNGYQEDQIVLSWMDFKEPDIATGAKELADQHLEKILVFPASISADSIHTSIEIPSAIEKAGLPDEIEILYMGSWNDDPLVIEGIRQNILDCLTP